MPERHHHHHHWHDRDRDGYAYRAGEPGPGPNFYKLRRDTRNGKVAGVCAGIANHFGFDRTIVRLGWIASFFFLGPLSLFAYVIMAFIVKPEDGPVRSSVHTREDERFWRTFSVKPTATFSELKHRFRALDARVSDMERAVTSNEYGLKKAFRDLERGV